jgi:signal transduction histidine kinase
LLSARNAADGAASGYLVAAELHSVSQQISTGLALEDALAGVLRSAEKLLDAAWASIDLPDDDGAEPRRRFTTHETGEPHWDHQRGGLLDWLAESVIHTGEGLAIVDALSDSRTRDLPPSPRRAVVAVPMQHAEQTIGVLFASWREPRIVSSAELSLLEILATYGAIAVENARLHAREIAARRDAEDAHGQLQRFLASVAHDLEGPLTLVVAYGELLRLSKSGDAREIAQRALPGMERAARRIQRLVNDLLIVARIGARRFDVNPAPMDLIELLQDVVERQQGTTQEHEITLDAPADLAGEWDRERLADLFANLIANAINYSLDGGEIRVVVDEVGDGVIVKVVDRGVGIAPEQVPQLFQPFSRLDLEPTTKGAGLGLYIAKTIVELHGGRIWVKSEPGQGSTFAVALPRRAHARHQLVGRTYTDSD